MVANDFGNGIAGAVTPFDRLKRWAYHLFRPPKEYCQRNAQRNLRCLSKARKLILDCGCGRGDNIIELERSLHGEHRVIGLDVFFPDLRECKDRVTSDTPLVGGTALRLPFADSTIDAVLSNQVIEHIREYDTFLEEISRVLRPGGLLVISTPNFHCPRNVGLRLLGQKPVLRWPNLTHLPPEEFRGHTQEFTEEELVRVVRRHGFALEESLPIVPRPTVRGNLLFDLYSLAEFTLYLLTRPFVAKGYSINNNMLFRRASSLRDEVGRDSRDTASLLCCA